MLDYILFRMLLLGKRYYFNPVNLSGAESTVPEQATFKHSIPIFLRILFFIVPIISGFSFGCIIGMTVEPSDHRYCIIIHFLAISLFCYSLYTFARTRMSWVNWQGQVVLVLLLYIFMEKVDLTLFSFCPLSMYIALFAVFAGHILYKI